MPTAISEADWQRLLSTLGEDMAAQTLEENDLTVDPGADDDPELQEATDPTGGSLAVKSTEAAPLAVKPGKKPDPFEVFQRGRGSIAKTYDDAVAQIEARYKGPGTDELLLAIGSALMQPTESGRLLDAVGNASKTLLPWAQSKREHSNELLKARTGFDLQRAKALADYEEKYLTASMKTPSSAVAANPVTGALYNKQTGFDVPTADHVNGLLQNPSKVAEFNIKFGPGAGEEILTQYTTGGQ